MNINRDYLIINDVKKSNIRLDNGSMFFYITDKNTQNIFVNLVINVSNNELIQKYANIENAEDYTLTMNIVKPDNTYKIIEGKLHDKEKAIFEFDLKEDCVDKIGKYKCELLTKCNINNYEEITTSNELTYKVKSSVLNDLDDIVEAPEYPLVIQLFDKLSDIEQYEEDRRANELARQLAEEQRQTRFNTLDADMVDRVNAMDNKMDDIEARISTKEQAVDKLIVDTKVDIDNYKVAKDTEIDEYKTAKDQQINQAITNQNNKIDDAIANQNNKIDTAIAEQNNRIETVEANDNTQNTRLDALEAKDIAHETSITNIEAKNVEQDNRLDSIEAVNVSQGTRLDAIEIKNQQQDDRLLDIEKVNKRQDIDLKCLFTEAKNNMMDITEEGNSVYLQNSTEGHVFIDNIQGNTMVNCNKEPDKEIILNGNINTQGYSNVTLTEGVDGGLVDVALEGNTMVNVCDQKGPVAITKGYTVETGNHVALQGEYDGKCRPVVTGNTLWIDNDTEDVLTAFDDTKNLRLQSSFEDKVVTQEMVDNGEEEAENLGKYKVDYVISREDGTIGQTKTFYLNSPLLEGDTIEQQGNNVVHVHRSELRVYQTGDELTLPTDMTNTLVAKATPQYEVISQNDTILCDSYVNGHLDVDSVVPIEKVVFNRTNLRSLKYLYPNTEYIIQFESDNTGKIQNIYIGSDHKQEALKNVVKGINKVNITLTNTQSNTFPYFSWDGIGFNASNIVVTEATDQEFGYFEGMKSVGECEDLEVVSSNKNLFNAGIGSFTNKHNLTATFNGSKITLNGQVTSKRWMDTALPKPITLKAGTYTFKIYSELYNNGVFLQTYVDGKQIKFDAMTKTFNNDITFDSIAFNCTDNYSEAPNFENVDIYLQIEEGETETDYIPYSHNTQTLTHKPLRAVGDVKDRYVLIDGKWYIERNCAEVSSDGNNTTKTDVYEGQRGSRFKVKCPNVRMVSQELVISNKFQYMATTSSWQTEGQYITTDEFVGDLDYTLVRLNDDLTVDEFLRQHNDLVIVYPLATPTYEPIDYNPFTVYSDITHISNNSTIPCNMTIKNTGYNCLLKPSTTYTVSSNLGLNTVTTPSVLSEDCLRFYDTDTSDVTTMKDVLVLEGDYTTGKPIPSHFSGIESAFEQEYDEVVGKYKVKIRVQNEDASKENYIEFYIDEPLRGIRDVKDKVYVKDDKVVVERNCGSVTFDGSDDEMYTEDNVNLSGRNNYSAYYSNENIGTGSSYGEPNKLLCDKMPTYGYDYTTGNSGDETGVASISRRILVSVPKAKLSTIDLDGFRNYLNTSPMTFIYQLAEPTYEEVEYNDTKLFIESFKNSTLFYNSNVPVTSKLYYSYSVPIVDTVAQTANVTDQQDSMIIDLATQVAVMEMMLM